MTRQDAAMRARQGAVSATPVPIERPPTAVRGADGVLFHLPRTSPVVPVFTKVNGLLADPATGRRLRGRAGRAGPAAARRAAGPVSRVSFGAFVLTAFVAWKAFRLLTSSLLGGRWRRREEEARARAAAAAAEGGAVVPWASDDDEDEEAPLPPLRAIPAMLARAMPRLGPPSRAKQLSQQRRERPRRGAPTAAQKLRPRGAAQRGPTMLERVDAAARQQERQLGLAGPQPAAAVGLAGGPAGALPAPVPVGAIAPPPQQQPHHQQAGGAAAAPALAAAGAGPLQAQLQRPQRQQQRRARVVQQQQPQAAERAGASGGGGAAQ